LIREKARKQVNKPRIDLRVARASSWIGMKDSLGKLCEKIRGEPLKEEFMGRAKLKRNKLKF
jgi:hypothetical protein